MRSVLEPVTVMVSLPRRMPLRLAEHPEAQG
jgi:hypothetical protein